MVGVRAYSQMPAQSACFCLCVYIAHVRDGMAGKSRSCFRTRTG